MIVEAERVTEAARNRVDIENDCIVERTGTLVQREGEVARIVIGNVQSSSADHSSEARVTVPL